MVVAGRPANIVIGEGRSCVRTALNGPAQPPLVGRSQPRRASDLD
jgi:hypothetical protein